MAQLSASAARTAGTKVEGWKSGWEPGRARSKGATWVLGRSLKEVVAGEKSLWAVLSCAWISMPTVNSQPGTVWLSLDFFFLWAPDFLRALACSFSCLRKGAAGGGGMGVVEGFASVVKYRACWRRCC